jgi:hypothetical protein
MAVGAVDLADSAASQAKIADPEVEVARVVPVAPAEVLLAVIVSQDPTIQDRADSARRGSDLRDLAPVSLPLRTGKDGITVIIRLGAGQTAPIIDSRRTKTAHRLLLHHRHAALVSVTGLTVPMVDPTVKTVAPAASVDPVVDLVDRTVDAEGVVADLVALAGLVDRAVDLVEVALVDQVGPVLDLVDRAALVVDRVGKVLDATM